MSIAFIALLKVSSPCYGALFGLNLGGNFGEYGLLRFVFRLLKRIDKSLRFK